ncbi:MAG: LysR family transcriptional regulator [Chloroflexi bacterium]|nr:LysR family transcriptional regulator [Chloroflexota bacterium]
MEQDDPYRVLDLKALRCFWALGKRGSLTGAGIEMGISEPAVSKRIKSLERYLGMKLYEVRGGKVRLTDAGQRIWEESVSLFKRLGELERGLVQEEVGGTLTVAGEDPVHLYLLPQVIEQYRRSFPRVRLRLLARTAEETVDLVRRNEVDVGIIPRRDLAEGLLFKPWRSFAAYLLLPLGHPLASKARLSFRSLLHPGTIMSYPLIIGEAQEGEHHRLREILGRHGLPLNTAFEAPNAEAVKRFVALGLGIAIVSGICLAGDDRTRLEVVEVPPEFEAQTTYGVLIRGQEYTTAALDGFLSLLEPSKG